ncbi:hypothetical protein VTG60DRAFT_1764 [Thermothelomyces hinnuleus]
MSREPMDAGAAVDEPEDVQAQVLNATLAEIKTTRLGSADSDESRDRDCCVICLDAISDPCAALPCGHAHFDFLCLVSWLQEHPNCPLCKANVYKVRYADDQKAEAFYRVPNAPRSRNDGGGAQNSTNSLDATIRRRRFTSQSGLLRERERRPPRPPPTVDEAIQRRRDVYRHQLYSLHIGSNRISRYRPHPTPAQFASTPHLVSRARLWIRRELQVFSFLSYSSSSSSNDEPGLASTANSTNREDRRRRNNAEFLLEYIIAILKTVDIQGSAGQAEAMLADFLGRDHARLFLHELRNWLRSPAVGLAAWDREVQYPEPGSNAPRDVVSRSDSVDGENDDGDEGGSAAGEDEAGRWWRDRGGDHWVARGGGDASPRGKRKRRASGRPREGRVSRARGDTQGGG